jgi:hypothetical protein
VASNGKPLITFGRGLAAGEGARGKLQWRWALHQYDVLMLEHGNTVTLQLCDVTIVDTSKRWL